MLDPRTPFMTALLKSQQGRLVDRERLERLQGLHDVADAVGQLQDTEAGAWLEGRRWRNARERDLVLWDYLSETVGKIELRRFFPPDARRFSRAYVLKYDVANIKAALQGLVEEQEPFLLPIGVLHAKRRLEALAAAGSREELEDVLTRAGLRELALVIRDFDPAASRRARRGVELALEAAYHRALRKTARRLGGGHILESACGVMIDLANLGILCRSLAESGTSNVHDTGELFVPGGRLLDLRALGDALAHGLAELPRRLEHDIHRRIAADVVSAWERTGSLAVIDTEIEKHRLAVLHELLAPQVAPAVVMAWFLVVKEIELRNLRLALAAVEDGLGLDAVRRQLLL